MGWYLGIDGGGTKTIAVVVDECGRLRGRGAGGPCNIATLDDTAAAEAIRTAASAARADAGLSLDIEVDGVCAGVAGATAKGRRADFAAALPELARARRTRIEPDFTIAYWGATEGRPGIVLSAGTGAVAYGRNAQGRECRTDGRGFLLGDLGSAYWIGAQSVAITLEWLHGCAQESRLTRAVAEACAAADDADLVQWAYAELHPARMAALAPLVGRFADEGDGHAVRILTEAAGHLTDSVRRCADALGVAPGGCDIYLLGGLWSTGAFLRRLFVENVDRLAGGRWPIGAPRHEPAFGAALLALADAGLTYLASSR
jgi:glucosamine kinase